MRKLLHITDIHFGPNHLPDRAAGLAALVSEREPDHVVVSGDLTRRAKPSQFRAARRWLDSLRRPVFAVPGNHDVPMYRFWERLLVPFGAWDKHWGGEREPSIADSELHMVGVNSATNWAIAGGRLGGATRDRFRARFASAAAGAYRVAVIHHNLIRPPGLDDLPYVPSGTDDTLELLAASGVDLVLGGHAHQSFRGRNRHPGRVGRAPTLMLYAGTASSSRGRGAERGQNTCHWIEIGEDGADVGFCRWSDEVRGFVEDSRRHFGRCSAGSFEDE